MSNSDNIGNTTPATKAVDREARRREESRLRSAAARRAKKRALPPGADTVFETAILCLFDLKNLPPSKREARAQVIADVTRQVVGTLKAMGHPDVDEAWLRVVQDTADRLRTETWHHPLNHGAFAKTP